MLFVLASCRAGAVTVACLDSAALYSFVSLCHPAIKSCQDPREGQTTLEEPRSIHADCLHSPVCVCKQHAEAVQGFLKKKLLCGIQTTGTVLMFHTAQTGNCNVGCTVPAGRV